MKRQEEEEMSFIDFHNSWSVTSPIICQTTGNPSATSCRHWTAEVDLFRVAFCKSKPHAQNPNLNLMFFQPAKHLHLGLDFFTALHSISASYFNSWSPRHSCVRIPNTQLRPWRVKEAPAEQCSMLCTAYRALCRAGRYPAARQKEPLGEARRKKSQETSRNLLSF